MKKLPELFTNTFNKKIDNSLEYIKIKKDIKEEKNFSIQEIKNKIDNIFKSPNYIYKIKVLIELENEELDEIIIGKKGNNLITINNKLINISTIKDIKEKNKF